MMGQENLTPRDHADTPEPWHLQDRHEVALDRELVAAIRTMIFAVVGIACAAAGLIWWIFA